MKKATISLLLSLALIFSLAACGGSSSSAPASASSAPASSSSAAGSSDASSDTASSTPTSGFSITATDGYAQGRMGDTMNTYFFSFSVNSAYRCASLENYTPADGYELLVAEITVTNTVSDAIEMYDTDFQAQWDDDADDAFRYPITLGPDNEELDPVMDGQLPAVYTLNKDESKTGLLVFEIPVGSSDLSISYMEAFSDDTTGDTFFVFFEADQQANAA